jgi:TatD DNase family protein
MSTPTLIDSHCHIVFRTFEEDLDEVASRWREAGVTSLLHACVEPFGDTGDSSVS